ncbi:sugar ABC transporter substrate-binding protein [Marinomonas sp. 15G1-11]|uniref:Sugar ABC transporter substrate-binding protein n=1 Tax=Marinomonas phaeophyticola TaxID=3004091 RepID=A0ABT4JPV4_9GAMM|nr:sugar ABC transporter substrate-binding protein [Marinomonas sp. 15G1-11]MCZ2720397.1 sugar ABC transporter substrate-binding protein [Marinomonas sp. 15G1-11]
MNKIIKTMFTVAAVGLCSSTVMAENKIGMMQHNQSDSFQQAMLKGAEEMADRLDYQFIDASSNDDPVKELEIIRNFAKRGVDLLVLGSTTQAAGVAGVELAHSLGMKVITMDSIQADSKAEGQVGGDDVAAGYYAAKHLAESIGGKGKVAINKFPDPIPPSEDRVKGFYKAFNEYPGIEVVAEAGPGYDTIKAMNWTAATIQANPDIKGFISIEDTSALGIVRGIENAKMDGKVHSVTVVESASIYKELQKGEVLTGVFAMHSYNYGALAVTLLDRLNHNRPVPFIVKTTGVLVTRDNVNKNLEYLNFD